MRALEGNAAALPVPNPGIFFALVSDPCCITDVHGTVERINPAFERMFGCQSSEVVHRPFLEFVHSDDRELLQAELESLAFESTATLSARFGCGGLSYRRIEWTCQKQTDLVYLAGRELSEARPAAWDSIRDWRERYEAVIGTTEGILFEWHPETDAVAWSGSYQTILGYSSDEMPRTAAGWAALVHPADVAQFLALVDRVRATREIFDLEYRVRRRDGAYVVLRDRGGFMEGNDDSPHVIGVLQDVTGLHSAEQALRRQAQLLEQVHDAIIATDMEGRILTWNPGAERTYGYTSAEAIGRNIQFLYFDEDWQALQCDVLDPLCERELHQVVVRRRRRDGSEIFVALRLAALRDEAGFPVGIVGCSNDITEQRRVEQALHAAQRNVEESLAQLSTLFRTAPVGLALLDHELRYVRINDALAEFNGYPAAFHLGRKASEIVPLLAPTIEPMFRKVLETGQAAIGVEVSGETSAQPGRQRYWEASYYPVQTEDGRTLGVGAVVNEVTERKEAERLLREERDFAKSLIDTAQSIILVLDTQGRIVQFNRFLEQLSGYRLEEVQGQDWFESFLPARDRTPVRQRFHQAISNIETAGQINPILTRRGEERPISWWSKALKDADGRTIGLLAIGQDMSQLIEAQYRVLRAERLAAIGQTVAVLSHEVRNELANIGMGLKLLLQQSPWQQSPDAAEEREIIELMGESQQRLVRLFEDVRGFSAPIILDRTDCSLSDVWQRAWAGLQAQRETRDIQLLDECDGIDLHTRADAFRLEQVFRNLFENSLTASPDPVRIRIRCAAATLDGRPVIQITVSDNGPGFDAEQREKIFEPFFTTKAKGTGLGMVIVRRIIEAHGGTITLGDPDQPGAEFVILLPREP